MYNEINNIFKAYKVEENSLIFFEVNEGVYMSIGLNDGKIYFADKIVAESLLDFLKNVVDPDYWTEI